MDAGEVVKHVVQGYGSLEVFKPFAEAVCEPGKPAHGHAHCEVLAFPEITARRAAMCEIKNPYCRGSPGAQKARERLVIGELLCTSPAW